MILFGLAEIATGISHSFFGLKTSEGNAATYMGIALGASYFIGGLLLLPNRKSMAVIAIAFLIIDTKKVAKFKAGASLAKSVK